MTLAIAKSMVEHFKTNMGLFSNFFKSPAPAPVIKPVLDDEMGDTGTTIFHGMISDEEYNSGLVGTAKYRVYDKMRKGDATVAASLKVLKLPLLSANWDVEAASQDEADIEKARFIEHNLKEAMTISWQDFLRQSLLMVDYGVFVFEKVFTYVEFEGKQYIGWKKLAPRHPKTITNWGIGNDKNEPGITQLLPTGKSVEIPMDKLLIFINEREGDNYEGVSVLRSAYKHWFYKDIFEQIDAMAFERQGLGVPYCKLPAGADDKDKANAKALVKNLRANEKAHVVFPDGYEVGFLDMKAKATRDPKSSIDYHNRQIVLNVLAQFLMLGAGESGSFALSKDQSGFFYDSLQAVGKNICAVISKHAIQQLCDFNWPGMTKYPKLRVDDIGAIDKDKFATMLNTLITNGIIEKDDELVKYVRNELDLPVKQVGDDDDQETDDLLTELDLLSVDVAGEADQAPDVPEEIKQTMSEEREADILYFNEMFEDEAFLFGAAGKPLDETTKSKISEAMKQYWASKGHSADISQYDTSSSNISDAKRRIDELKAVIDNFKKRAGSIKDKKTKKAFNAKVKEKIEEIKKMIAAGKEGIKKEKARQTEAKTNITKDIKTRKLELRKSRMKSRIEKDLIRIERLDAEINKTDSPSKKAEIKQKIEEVKQTLQDRKDTLAEIENQFNEPPHPLPAKKKLYQLNENFKPFRKLTYAEKKVNFGNLQNEFVKREKEFAGMLKDGMAEKKDEILSTLKKAIEAGDYAMIAEMGIEFDPKYQTEMVAKMKELYNFGKNAVAAEMKITSPATPQTDIDRLEANANIIMADHANKISTKTKMKAMDSVAKGVTTAKALERVGIKFDEAIEELSQQTSSVIVGGSINQGRRATQFSRKGDIYALQRSELLDDRTCMFCMSMDGRTVTMDDPWAQEDIFHSNCRGIWVEIMNDEPELPKITEVPESIAKKYDGMNDLKQPKTAIVKKGSLAADAVKEEYKKDIAKREAKIAKYTKDNQYPDRVEKHQKQVEVMKKVLDKLK
jgi:hypothetical protein